MDPGSNKEGLVSGSRDLIVLPGIRLAVSDIIEARFERLGSWVSVQVPLSSEDRISSLVLTIVYPDIVILCGVPFSGLI